MKGEEARSTEDGAIAAKGGDQIDLVWELGGWIAAGGGIDGEGQVVVNSLGDAAFKDDVDIWMIVMEMLGETSGILDDPGSMELGNEKDVSGGLLPVESEKAYGGLLVGGADPVREGRDIVDEWPRGCGGEEARRG